MKLWLRIIPFLLALWHTPAWAAACGPNEDGLKYLEAGQKPELERWLTCRRRCASDMDCLFVPGPCGEPRFFHREYEDSIEEFTAAELKRAKCPNGKVKVKVDWAECIENTCQARLEDCERERRAFLAFVNSALPRSCELDSDCKPLHLDPKPCADPLWFNVAADTDVAMKEIARRKRRVFQACGYAGNYADCAQQTLKGACLGGRCAAGK